MGSGASSLSNNADSGALAKAKGNLASQGNALLSALLEGAAAGLPAQPLFKQALAHLVKIGVESLGLEPAAINDALVDEIVPVHEESDLTKLAPALRHFSVLAEETSVEAAAAAAKDAEAAIVESPESGEALAAVREAHAQLKASYRNAIEERVKLDGLFQKAAEAVVAGGDAFGQIYTSVWTLVDKPNVSEEDDRGGEGILAYKAAVKDHLADEVLHPPTPLADLQGMADMTDAGEYMRSAAKLRVPFGEMVSAIVDQAAADGGFKVHYRK